MTGLKRRLQAMTVAASALGLCGCVTDPAFLEGLAIATNAMATETAIMAEESRCYRHLSMTGEWVTLCPLPHGYVAPPTYIPPPRAHDRPRDRYRDRDRRPHRSDRYDRYDKPTGPGY